MRILLLTFYFKPDLSAGSFRAAALVDAIVKQLPENGSIDVITSLPNRYKTFSVDAPEIENSGAVTIHRVPVAAHKSGLLDQSRSFLEFSRSVFRLVANKDYDLIFATSSRLMTAVLAAAISSRKKTPLYLDIRDIFVDTIGDVLPIYLSLITRPLFGFMERFAIKRAAKVNLVSPGFEQYFSSRYKDKHFSFFTNGIDDEFIEVSRCKATSKTASRGVLKVLYAGNIGEGQGLHEILPELAARMYGKLFFQLFGDGGRKEILKSRLESRQIDNVVLSPPLSRDELIKEYQDADVLFLHLNDYDAFRKVLPSKIFEYAAVGKPIWAGIAGYSAEFVRSEISNAAVFNPCDSDDAVQSFDSLTLEYRYREKFIAKYGRREIMEKMAQEMINLLKEEN